MLKENLETMDPANQEPKISSDTPDPEPNAKSSDAMLNTESGNSELSNLLLNNSITDIPLGVELMQQAPHSNYIMDLADKPLDIMSKVKIIVQPELENGFSSMNSGLYALHLEETALTIPTLSPAYLVMTFKPEEKLVSLFWFYN